MKFSITHNRIKISCKIYRGKIQKVSQTITSFAGISFTNNEFNRCGFSQLIDNELSLRTLTGYQ
jgi:hypothetical protein